MKINNYAEFYDWEFELICTRQKQDVQLWQKLAARYGDPLLEICCGSGRITRKLADMGWEITALDNSPEMLKLLENKHLPNVKTVLADMRNFSLAQKFRLIIIGYSSFQQLLTLNDQIKCLKTIKKHLREDGVLALDINPRVCEGPDILPREISYIADYPAHNSRVTMFTSHKIDRLKQIKHWRDFYLEIDAEGNRNEFSNRISLKECSRDYLLLLFEKCGFHIVDIFGDFNEGKVRSNSENIVWVVK